MVRIVNEMDQLNFVQYLPLAIMAYGDFVAANEGNADDALPWHQKAKEMAIEHGLGGQAKLADLRIKKYKGS